MMTHDEMLDSVAAYALGLLSADEAKVVAAHLETCERCREEYRFLQPAVTALAYSAEAGAATSSASAPGPLLKARVMNRVRAETARRSVPRDWPAYALAAAALALAILTGLVDLSLNHRLDRDRAQLAAQAQMTDDLTAPDSRHYRFAGGEVLARGDRLYIAMRDLPMPPPGRIYQAWTLAKGATKVAPSVTFTPTRDGVAVIRLPEAVTTLAAVAVSNEPEGGSRQPTTKPIAMVRI